MPEQEVVPDLAHLLTGHAAPEDLAPSAWPALSRAAGRHKLAPLLCWTLEQRNFSIPDPAALQYLQNAAKIADFNFQLLREVQLTVGPALAEASIPVIWLKGLALAQTVYPLPHLRPMDDLDLLVPYERRDQALEIIQSLEYVSPPQDPMAVKMGVPSEAPHHYHLLGGPAYSVNLELHYRLLVDDRLLPLDQLDWFWQQSGPAHPGEDSFMILKPEAHLIYLAAHAILQHGEADFRLQRYYDLHLLANLPGLDWDLLVSRARALGWTYAVERALTLTREYFDTPIPREVLPALQARSQPEETELRARRLQGGVRWEGTLLGLEGLPLRQRLRQLFWLTFPPPSYLRQRYAVPPGRSVFPCYFHRWFDAGREIIKSLAHRMK